MAYFIKITSRKTWTKMLVEAETGDDVLGKKAEYVGVVYSDDDSGPYIIGPFATKEEALKSIEARVEFRQ